ncbi:MAG: heptose kinase [Gammaproteobacteria bacterium]|nr:heptose kinase [Gammaproteobacteria bacterium]
MSHWQLAAEYQTLQADFGSLEKVFALQGERITHDSLSELIRVTRDGVDYYVKRYRNNGTGLRKYAAKPRIKAEWQNLKRFAKWGIPTAQVIAQGLERRAGAFVRGAMITREIPDTRDLADLANSKSPLLQDRAWVQQVSVQVAHATRVMHDHSFTHNDLKWRNLLVDKQAQVYLIDCPAGTFWWGAMLRYRIIKDLACLDKVAQYQLSQTQRLRFYLQYCQRARLTAQDKKQIAKIVRFFEGRE